jgi:hypothetical protein
MKAPYTPPTGQAQCPHCAAPVAVTLEAPAVELAALQLRCGQCAGRWNELRGRGPTERYWTPVAAEQPA